MNKVWGMKNPIYPHSIDYTLMNPIPSPYGVSWQRGERLTGSFPTSKIHAQKSSEKRVRFCQLWYYEIFLWTCYLVGNEGDIVRSTQVLHDLFCTLYSLIFDSLRKLGKKKALPTFRNGMEDSPTWMSHTFKKVLSLLGIPTRHK